MWIGGNSLYSLVSFSVNLKLYKSLFVKKKKSLFFLDGTEDVPPLETAYVPSAWFLSFLPKVRATGGAPGALAEFPTMLGAVARGSHIRTSRVWAANSA